MNRALNCLLGKQKEDGHWVGELQGDTILESEYILLMAFLGRENEPRLQKVARYILSQAHPEGGWSNYPGGPAELSVSVKAYFALKLTGHDPEAPYMQRARRAICALGGASGCNSFTKFYLAFLGQIPYENCPTVPPEMILLPTWAYINIYAMSSWTRTIVVPLSIFSAYKPVRQLPRDKAIPELFVTPPLRHDWPHPPSPRWFTAHNVFLFLDQLVKVYEKVSPSLLRQMAIQKAHQWMLEHLAESDGLGAIFPPMIYTVISLHCLGYAADSPEMKYAHKQLEDLMIEEGDTIRLQPCHSPVWDTALTLNALAMAQVPPETEPVQKAVRWLLEREVRRKGDWSVLNPDLEPAGWFFEYRNGFYPDIDDTAMVLMGLARTGWAWQKENAEPGTPSASAIPLEFWNSQLHGNGNGNGHVHGNGKTNGKSQGLFEFSKRSAMGVLRSALRPLSSFYPSRLALKVFRSAPRAPRSSFHVPRSTLHAPLIPQVERGLRWLLAMQNKDGGWAAFDRDINRELLTQVPFADHNAMLDPSCPDITARVLEALGQFGFRPGNPQVDRALAFLDKTQDARGGWPGRWGVNFVYGTWQVLQGLEAVGYDMQKPMVRRAVLWLKKVQQSCGGWGESCKSYDDPSWAGKGDPTASQTAWALLALIAAGEADTDAVRAGIHYLTATQKPDGSWDEPQFTGTGFPKVFYLKYHLYSLYFPVMALARYQRLQGDMPPPHWNGFSRGTGPQASLRACGI